MKTKIILSILFILGLGLTTLLAQNPIATLEHNGTSQVFYGQNSFVDAYNASVNGDQIYLSTGFFTPPPAIAKGIKITGAGHFPDSANVAKRTFVMGGLSINKGADSLQLEGLYVNDDLNFQRDASINFVKFVRCRVRNAGFNSNSATASKNNCSFEECFIDGNIAVGAFGRNLHVKNNIIKDLLQIVEGGLIEGNIFLHNGGSTTFDWISGSFVRNNVIFDTGYNYMFYGGTGSNNVQNNLFIRSSCDFGVNSYSNNYLGIPQSEIFVNQTGNTIDYSHDYHLKNPELYLGTDGTQVGIYGGSGFKEKGLPSNPQITSKTIAPETDTEGNLKVDITVKAQEN